MRLLWVWYSFCWCLYSIGGSQLLNIEGKDVQCSTSIADQVMELIYVCTELGVGVWGTYATLIHIMSYFKKKSSFQTFYTSVIWWHVTKSSSRLFFFSFSRFPFICFWWNAAFLFFSCDTHFKDFFFFFNIF